METTQLGLPTGTATPWSASGGWSGFGLGGLGGTAGQGISNTMAGAAPYSQYANNDWGSIGLPNYWSNGQNVNSYGVPFSGSQYATNTLADISLQDYSIYQHYFQPLESMLTNMVNNPAYNNQQYSTAMSNSNQQFQNYQGQYQRDLARSGMSLNPGEQQSMSRTASLSSALNNVNTANMTSRGLQSNQLGIMGGLSGMPIGQLLQQLPPQSLGQ